MIDIPQRASNDSDFKTLSKLDRQIIRAAVLLGLDNQSAYALYHPAELDSNGRLNEYGKKQSSHFWSYGKNREYREAYEKTVEEFINGGKRIASDNRGKEISEQEKADALHSMFRYVIDNSIDIEKLEDPTILLKIADKIGFFEQIEKKNIAPIRVLPEVCSRCRMKVAVESMVLNGEILDMCAYCKCRSIAEDNGYRFNDGKDLLDIPKEVIDDLESKNNIKLTDILDGKIEN